MRLVYKQHQVVAFFDLAYDSLYPLLEHPPQHRTRHYSGHLELDEVGISQPLRHAFGLEFYLAGQAFDHRRLADPGLSYEHRGVRPLAMTQNFDHLADLFIPADHRRELVLASELVQADAEVFQVRRQFIPAPILFLLFLVTADSCLNLLHYHLPVRAEPLKQIHREAVWVLEQRNEQVSGLDQSAAALVSMLERIGQQRSERFRHFDAAAEVLPLVELGLKGLEHNLRIEIQALHYFVEERALDLGNCYEDM